MTLQANLLRNGVQVVAQAEQKLMALIMAIDKLRKSHTPYLRPKLREKRGAAYELVFTVFVICHPNF